MRVQRTRRVSLIRWALSLLAGAAFGGPLMLSPLARAHHSASMFDQQRTLDLTVQIKEFQWTNPHVWIQVFVDEESGEKVEWSIEGGGRNSLARSGWRPTTFNPGDVVRMRFNPMRDGSPAGLFIGAKFADGSTIGRWEEG
jgi:hypothetical protein